MEAHPTTHELDPARVVAEPCAVCTFSNTNNVESKKNYGTQEYMDYELHGRVVA